MKTFWIRTVSAIVYVILFLGTMFSGVFTGNLQVGVLIFGAFLLFVTVCYLGKTDRREQRLSKNDGSDRELILSRMLFDE